MARKPPPTRKRRPDDARIKRKGCMYCHAKVGAVDYKEFQNLRVVVSEKGKLKARRTTGLCQRHQTQAAVAVKRAREVALLPYVAR